MRQAVLSGRTEGLRPSQRRRLERLAHRRHPPDVVAERSARALRPGCILLLHDADGWDPDRLRAHTAAAIPDICAAARDKGLELVTLDELVA